jgi:hypothetical protein
VSKALDGQVAVITGGARGQGRADAVALAQLGARIVLCDVPAPMRSVQYELGSADDLALTVSLVREAGSSAIALAAEATVERDANGEPLSDEILGKRFAAHHPIPRPWVYPQDVAREVVHLVTEPGNITGAVIEIGLGQSARAH